MCPRSAPPPPPPISLYSLFSLYTCGGVRSYSALGLSFSGSNPSCIKGGGLCGFQSAMGWNPRFLKVFILQQGILPLYCLPPLLILSHFQSECHSRVSGTLLLYHFRFPKGILHHYHSPSIVFLFIASHLLQNGIGDTPIEEH